MPSLPTVTSDIPRDLRQYLDRVRENIDGVGLDEIITARKLIAAGLAQYAGGSLTSTTGGTQYATPPAPLNLDADGALMNIIVTWDKAVYPGHAYTEIWAAVQTSEQAAATPEQYPDLGEALLVGMAPGSVWVHNIGGGASRWYWARFVNVEGLAGPFNLVGGTRGDTATDPAHLLTLLSGQIAEGQLAQSLEDRIDLIDGGESLAGSVAARIATVQDQVNELLNLPEWVSTTSYAVGDQVVYNGFLYAALVANTNVIPSSDDTKWDEIGEYSTLGDAVAAHTNQISALTNADTAQVQSTNALAAQMRGNYTGTDLALVSQGLIFEEKQARATADNSLASDVTAVTAFVNTKARTFYQSSEPTGTSSNPLNAGDIWIDTNLSYPPDYVSGDYVVRSNLMYRYDGTNWVQIDVGFADLFSAVISEKTARVTEDESLASDITTLITNTDNSLSTINQTLSTHSTDISSNASAITTLTATVNSNNTTLSAALQAEQTARADEDEALADTIETVQASLGDDITAAVQTETSARVAADGAIEAKNTVKVDIAGHVSGYGLISTANDSTPASEFGIRADAFWLAPPAVSSNSAPTENLFEGYVWVDTTNAADPVTKYYDGANWTTTPQNLPFIVRTTPTTINGETVGTGVYMDDAFIANGTITNAKIGDAAIDNAKIANVDAGKINAGFINAARIEAGSITASMIDSRGLSIKDNNGNVILSSGTPLDISNISGLGAVAEYSEITLSDITDAGELAALDEVTESDLSSGLAGTIDGKVESWFQTTDPATGWTDNTIRAKHLGDLWWKTDTNKLYRYKYSSSVYSWEVITDQTATDAYANAATAQDTADGKRRVFTSGPVPPYDVGDLWDRGATIGLYRCYTARSTGAFVGADWQVVADTTSQNTAASITNQGNFATLDQVTAANISTYIANGAIGNAYIGNVIQSANYNEANQTGWKIDKTGAMVMNNATFRGALDVDTGSGSRLVVKSDRIEVYDGNTLRVRLGNLYP